MPVQVLQRGGEVLWGPWLGGRTACRRFLCSVQVLHGGGVGFHRCDMGFWECMGVGDDAHCMLTLLVLCADAAWGWGEAS